MPSPIISVIIPAHNRPDAIVRCLDALAAQTVAAWSFEVIVVDDGSEPPLAIDASRWTARFPLMVIHQRNTGPSGARNRGVAATQAEFLAFTDDDCLPEPTWLDRLLATLRDSPTALVGGSTRNGRSDDICSETSQLIVELVYRHFNSDRQRAYFFASNNFACARHSFEASGGFDQSFRLASEDRDFCDRWRMNGAPLIWLEDAWIEHHHPQTFREFANVHFRYGVGAWQYQRTRSLRQSGSMTEDLAFHRTLIPTTARLLARYPLGKRIRIALLLVWWQLVNAIGFFAGMQRRT